MVFTLFTLVLCIISSIGPLRSKRLSLKRKPEEMDNQPAIKRSVQLEVPSQVSKVSYL
jgi:hypothetical protein